MSELNSEAIQIIEDSGLFRREWYLQTNPDVAAKQMDPLHHYILYGADEGRAPNHAFDVNWYTMQYLGGPGSKQNPLLHYISDGDGRGYHANPILQNYTAERDLSSDTKTTTKFANFLEAERLIIASHLFQCQWYLDNNRDVATSGINPIWHYLTDGATEGRDPNRIFATSWYASQHLGGSPSQSNPLIHYIRQGATQGLSTHPNYPTFMFPGLRTGTYVPESTPAGNFIRAMTAIETSNLFERDWYLDKYKDVAASNGDPLWHYLFHGVAEGRNPSRTFDTRWYLSAYPLVGAEGRNPLEHYISEGLAKGCKPHPFISAAVPKNTPPLNWKREKSTSEHQDTFAAQGGPVEIQPHNQYDVHRATNENYRKRTYQTLRAHVTTLIRKPSFIVLVDGTDDAQRRETENSLNEQIYNLIFIARTKDEVAKIVSDTKLNTPYLLWLDAGDVLDPDALYELAATINADPYQNLIYFDHDIQLESESSWPLHKPDWSPDYLESTDYIGPAACFGLENTTTDLLTRSVSRYDFILRFTERDAKITHLEKILLHRPACRKSITQMEEATEIRALIGRLERTGRTGTIRPFAPQCGFYEASAALAKCPLVSIVIPTAARVIDYEGEKIDLIVQCLESILSRSSYKNIEFIVVDNGDFDRNRIAHLHEASITFVTYASREINIAKKINLGATQAKGSVLVILNDDVVPIADNWLERMLFHLEKPHVGLVGAKLVYPNETLQHVGVVICDGQVEHVRRGWPRNDMGYGFSTACARNYLAVTGAVMMVRADDFNEVGGYSEDFPIDYNDIDFSLKLYSMGMSIVYEPGAELYHYESVSVIKPARADDANHFSRKWAKLSRDPFYNEYCLSKHPATYELDYTERKH